MATETLKTHVRRLARSGKEQMMAFGDGSIILCGALCATENDVYANDRRISTPAGPAALESLVTCAACRAALLAKRRAA